jgi:thiol-disulfide isomerase/thioredoxin
MKVLAFVSACLVIAPLAAAETVLLDFHAKWCGPCRDMDPVVAGLEREGYRIERVNIDSEQGKLKARQFNVKNIPTFVALADGRETGRVVGAVPAESLKRLVGPAGIARSNNPKPSAATAAATETSLESLPNAGSGAARELIDRSVRIVVEEAKSRSFGTGTVIRSVPGETLVLTCGHLFENVSRIAKTTVEFFGSPIGAKLSGEAVARDKDADLALVRIVTDQVFPVARVASREFTLRPGIPTQSVGCDHGQPPTLRKMKVLAVNRYLGAPTIECNNEPVEGRSGGGLFSEAGELIGVCSAREPREHRGIYGGLAAVHTLLDRQGLASLYSKPASGNDWRLASNARPAADASATDRVVLPPPDQLGVKVGLTVPPEAEQAEVVCLIRSRDNIDAPPRIVVLDCASAEFLNQLEKERKAQPAQSNTSMRLTDPADRRAGGTEPNPRLTPDSKTASPRGADARPSIEESAKWKKDWAPGARAKDSAGLR